MDLHVVSRWLHRRHAHDALSSRAAYDAWAPSYPATAHNPLMRVEQGIIEAMLARVSMRTALDVGTGSGRYLSLLAKSGARRIVGLDLSMAMLTRHPTPFPRTCADARHLPFRNGTFEFVISSLMAGDIDDLSAYVGELARVLTPGGHLVYSDFHPCWSRHGWRRTFTADDGRVIDMPYHAHAMEEHLTAVDRAKLRVAAIREPRLDSTDTRSRRAQRRWGHLPVLVIVHATKPRLGDRPSR